MASRDVPPDTLTQLIGLAEGPTTRMEPADADGGSPAPAPAVAGGYVLLDRLAEGGMGVMFRAHDVGLQRDVAVKLVKDEYRTDPAVVARFLEEARITGRLQHPGIPAVHQIGILPDGRAFLAMKL